MLSLRGILSSRFLFLRNVTAATSEVINIIVTHIHWVILCVCFIFRWNDAELFSWLEYFNFTQACWTPSTIRWWVKPNCASSTASSSAASWWRHPAHDPDPCVGLPCWWRHQERSEHCDFVARISAVHRDMNWVSDRFWPRQVCSFVNSTKNCVYSCHECIVGVDQILFANF